MYRSLLLCCICMCSLLLQAQQAETFHAHLNKEMYLPGETVWFKAYIFNNNLPSETSSLFAVLYDENGKLVETKQLPVFLGTSEGSFKIPDSIASSHLFLNLFTKNTLPENRAKTYNKIFSLYQGKSTDILNNQQTGKIMVDAAAEGGNLVAQMPNLIFIKAYGANGSPVSTSLAVKSMKAELIDSVMTDRMGMASFSLQPAAGEQYYITWKDAGGEQQKLLQAPLITGAVLHSEISNSNLFYVVKTNSTTDNLKDLKVLLLNAKDTLFWQAISFKNSQSYIGKMSTDSISPGLFKLVLLDKAGNIVQQKNIVISKNINPVVKTLAVSQQKKGKNIIEITMPADDTYYLSASVSAAEFSSQETQTSITDELLLSRSQNGLAHVISNHKLADLFVNVHAPTYKYIVPNQQDNYLSVAVSSKESVPANAELDLVVTDKGYGKQFYKVKQSAPGVFTAKDLLFYDSAKMHFQVAGNKELSANLSLRAEPFPMPASSVQSLPSMPVQYESGYINRFSADAALLAQKETLTFNDEQTMQNVVVNSKYVNPVTKRLMQIEDQYATGMFKGLARGTQLNVLDDPTAQNSDPFNYILYRAGSIAVRGTIGSRSIISTRQNGGGPLLLFIDENPADFFMLESIQMSRVAYIKIIVGVVITAGGVSDNGAIYVYSKKGNEEKSITMKSAIVKGYDFPEEFRMPDYSIKDSDKQPDYRSALYWDANIVTDKNNRSFKIEYYNNDVSKGQVLTVKGISSSGDIIEYKKIIQ